ncbi:MAG: hypothetical protein ACRD1H_03220, partial [Vicinamibacterales bacterium]
MPTDVTLVTVLYRPDWSRTGRILRDALAAADACGLVAELLVINSRNPTVEAVGLAAAEDRVRAIWNQGYNVYLAGALTTAVREARSDTLVYVCASHGVGNDPTWISDLVAPLADPKVGLAGHVQPCEFNRVTAVPDDIIEPQIHVQGGLWAARTGLLREIGFSHRF